MANFESMLKTKVANFVKASASHGQEAKLVFAMSAAFTIIHGRADYLTQLVNGANAGDKALLMSTLESFNTHALKELFKEGKEFHEILATLADQNKLAMRVPVFAAVKDKDSKKITSIAVLTSPGAKAMRAHLSSMFSDDEQKLADALVGITDIAVEKVSRAVDAQAFDEFDYFKRVMQTVIKKMAKEDDKEAIRVANIINSQIIQDSEKRMSKGEIEELVKKAKAANENESSVDKKPGEGNDTKPEVSTDNLQEKRGREPANRVKKAA